MRDGLGDLTRGNFVGLFERFGLSDGVKVEGDSIGCSVGVADARGGALGVRVGVADARGGALGVRVGVADARDGALGEIGRAHV